MVSVERDDQRGERDSVRSSYDNGRENWQMGRGRVEVIGGARRCGIFGSRDA